MGTLNIIIADDSEHIHQDIRKSLDSLEPPFDYKIIYDCYSTIELDNYLKKVDNRLNVDFLILDHIFKPGTGENGLEHLPYIRSLCPKLPILMLTTFGDYDGAFVDAQNRYNVKYFRKPIAKYQLRAELLRETNLCNQLEELRKALAEDATINELKKSLSDAKEMEELVLNENSILSHEKNDLQNQNAILQNQNTILQNQNTDLQNQNTDLQNSANSAILKIQKILRTPYPNLEFHKKSIKTMLGLNDQDLKLIGNCLTLIGTPEEKSDGVKKQRWGQDKYPPYDLWEYRFSHAGRIIVGFSKNANPFIYCIYPHHEHGK